MSSKPYIVHKVSNNQPTGLQVGDEYYDPVTNRLYKALAVNGTTVTDTELVTAGTERFRITSAGDVGIGTVSPSTKLQVVGDVAATNFNSTSDINKKHNIETIEGALDIVNKLRGVRFNWNHNDQPGIGVVAQEIEQYVPEVVVSMEDSKTVQYGNLIGLLIEAIKELSSQIEAQKHST